MMDNDIVLGNRKGMFLEPGEPRVAPVSVHH